jgi:cell division topological specificity factor
VDFLRRLFGGKDNSSSSAQEAKKRLQIVLINDRTDISPQLLENLRAEMIAVLTKYMDIDEPRIEMDRGHDESAVALIANIPVLRIKRGAGGTLEDRFEDNPDDRSEGKFSPRGEPPRNQNIKSRRRK